MWSPVSKRFPKTFDNFNPFYKFNPDGRTGSAGLAQLYPQELYPQERNCHDIQY
jgi:hypothetical protein